MTVVLSAAEACAIGGASRLIALIHNKDSDSTTPWLREIEQRRYLVVGQKQKNVTRGFNVLYHIGNHPSNVITVGIQVKKIIRTKDTEKWVPVSAILFSNNNGSLNVMYTCEFNWKTGVMTLTSRSRYPYADITD